jgi:NAD(P)H-hydrate epimerase
LGLGSGGDRGVDALAVGPGLSTHSDTKKLLLDLVENVEIPLVIDADGVNNLSGSLRSLGKAKARGF